MTLERTALRRGFDRAAPHYERHAWLQREVAGRLLDLPQAESLAPRWIADLGCGSGRLTAELKRRWPRAAVSGLDIAPAMLAAARHHRHWYRTFGLLCGDLAVTPFRDGSIDLLVSNLAVQWSAPGDTVFAEWRRILRPGGAVLFSTFGPATLHELRRAWRAADEAVHVHDFVDLHEIGDRLVAAGFKNPVLGSERLEVYEPDVETVMRGLRAIGAGNADHARRRGLTGKAAYGRMRQAYECERTEHGLPVTWEAIIGAAFAPAANGPAKAGDVIPLAELRHRRPM